jgi:hypothetical protein
MHQTSIVGIIESDFLILLTKTEYLNRLLKQNLEFTWLTDIIKTIIEVKICTIRKLWILEFEFQTQ